MRQVDRLAFLRQPTPEQILAARQTAGLTQAEAGALVHSPSYRAWQDWERGRRPMRLDTWELFLLKTDQHPRSLMFAKPKLDR